jgi:hypothetical protein
MTALPSHFANNWDIFGPTERLALIRNLPREVGNPIDGWVNCEAGFLVTSRRDHNYSWHKNGIHQCQWAELHPLVQVALSKIDWQFNLGRPLPGFPR